jgi:diaminopimelate epimerase
MAYYNADGGEVEMCGNGGRCISRYAYINGIAGEEMSFETMAGLHHARIVGDNVRLGMIDPQDVRLQFEIPMDGGKITGNFINTGVPHVVVFVSDVEMIDVVHLGAQIRYHSRFAPAGTNANFAQIIDHHTIKIRTYERGVEDETLACGTGTVASAVTGALLGRLLSPVEAHTRSGLDLTVYFQSDGQRISDVYLEGDARFVFEGTLVDEWILDAL